MNLVFLSILIFYYINHFYNTFINITFAFVIGLFLLYLYKKGLRLLDRKFHRAKFDYKKVVTELSELIKQNISIEHLLTAVLKKLKDVVLLKKVGILLTDERGRLSIIRFDTDTDAQFISGIKSNEDELFPILKDINSGFRVEYLNEKLKKLFISENIQMLIPIISKNKVIGALLLGDKLSESPINNEDILFIQSYASQIVVSLENALLYEDLAEQARMKHELELARKIQSSSLPHVQPQVNGLEVAAISVPAYEVGGDFYDYLNYDSEHITIVVGDVSGKGASAALYMSKAQGILRTLADFELSPMELMARSNSLLHKYIDRNSFISVIAAAFDMKNRTIKVARAGHLPLFMYKASERAVLEIKPNGIVLGVSGDNFFREHIQEETLSISKGDIFLFATDGAIENKRDGDEFGAERLKALLPHFKTLTAQELVNQIFNEINIFAKQEALCDDLTLLAIKVV